MSLEHGPTIAVGVVASPAEMAALGVAWEGLQREAAVTSVFSSFDWQRHWWEHYGRGRALRLLVARAGGEVVGVLPLYIETMPLLRVPVRVLRLVGCGGDTSPDDLGPVLAATHTAAVARALADAVLSLPGWDVSWLTDLDPRNVFGDALRDAAAGASLPTSGGRSERITFTTLPATFDDWLRTLHRDRRQRIRSMRKKLHAAHPDARHFVWRDAATLDVAIDRLVELHTRRWELAGVPHSFSSAEYISFHRAVMHACLARDRLRLHCLEVAGQIVAMFYFYKFRDTTYLMQSGFDPDFSELRPGQVLLGYVVEHAIGERLAAVDFLRGEHRYKAELANGERETVWHTIYRRRPGAAVYFTRRVLLPALKARVQAGVRSLRERP